MYIQNTVKNYSVLEKKSLEYYNAWSVSESSRAVLLDELRNLTGEKFVLQQELEKGQKENNDLSTSLVQSNVTLQEDLQQLQQHRSALISQVQSLIDEKTALERELKKALKRTYELSTPLKESKVALQMTDEVHLTERLSRTQKKDTTTGKLAATFSTSGSVSPLSLEGGERSVKRPKRRAGAAVT